MNTPLNTDLLKQHAVIQNTVQLSYTYSETWSLYEWNLLLPINHIEMKFSTTFTFLRCLNFHLLF